MNEAFSLVKNALSLGDSKSLEIPEVRITDKVLEITVDEVLAYPKAETSWVVYGVRNTVTDEILVNGIILQPPGKPRNSQMTTIGDKSYKMVFRWLEANYMYLKKSRPDLADYAFETFFTGHSHHTLEATKYSGPDTAAIKDAVIKDGLPVALGTLANIGTNTSMLITPKEQIDEAFRVSRINPVVVLRFYYLSKRMVEKNYREPVLVVPEVVPECNGLFIMPPLPWVYTHPKAYESQEWGLKAYGCQVKMYFEYRNVLPLKVGFEITKPGWSQPVKILTDYDFPRTPAIIDSPVIPAKWFKNILGRKQPLGPNLVDLVKYAEKCLPPYVKPSLEVPTKSDLDRPEEPADKIPEIEVPETEKENRREEMIVDEILQDTGNPGPGESPEN